MRFNVSKVAVVLIPIVAIVSLMFYGCAAKTATAPKPGSTSAPAAHTEREQGSSGLCQTYEKIEGMMLTAPALGKEYVGRCVEFRARFCSVIQTDCGYLADALQMSEKQARDLTPIVALPGPSANCEKPLSILSIYLVPDAARTVITSPSNTEFTFRAKVHEMDVGRQLVVVVFEAERVAP